VEGHVLDHLLPLVHVALGQRNIPGVDFINQYQL
jgi:hypothetical protein